jgi:methyl halide transferase
MDLPGDINGADYWSDAYDSGHDGWDMGSPTPVFAALLQRLGTRLGTLGLEAEEAASITTPAEPRVLMPCCGRGHDALLFASHGYRVTAVDFATPALEHLREESTRRLLHLEARAEDMFLLDASNDAAYDLLLEYTCICAIDPSRRRAFVDLAARVLRPGGHLVTLLFPVDNRPGGPPFAVDADELSRMLREHFVLQYDVIPDTSVRPRLGRERLMIWRRNEA